MVLFASRRLSQLIFSRELRHSPCHPGYCHSQFAATLAWHQVVQMRTPIMNTPQALVMNEGERPRSSRPVKEELAMRDSS
jgi:hypothetical protein